MFDIHDAHRASGGGEELDDGHPVRITQGFVSRGQVRSHLRVQRLGLHGNAAGAARRIGGLSGF
ncbi:MAG: hypothetical protein ACE5F5_13685 [Acidimicrobiia bacterium]